MGKSDLLADIGAGGFVGVWNEGPFGFVGVWNEGPFLLSFAPLQLLKCSLTANRETVSTVTAIRGDSE